MKKKLLICLCICSLIAVSGSAFAAGGAGTSSQTGTTVTVGATPATELTYNTSPSVSMNVVASTTAYTIMAANILTDTSNGLQYGTKSNATGYAQGPKTTGAGSDLAANGPSTTGQTATAISTDVTWSWMGGSGS